MRLTELPGRAGGGPKEHRAPGASSALFPIFNVLFQGSLVPQPGAAPRSPPSQGIFPWHRHGFGRPLRHRLDGFCL